VVENAVPREDLKRFLEQYHRVILHLRYAHKSAKSLGIILGSGFSKDFKLPDWEKLIRRIAEHPQVDGAGLLPDENEKLSPLRDAQLLFERLLSRETNQPDTASRPSYSECRRVQRLWLAIVHDSLYHLPTGEFDLGEAIDKHAYAWQLLELLRQDQRFTLVNYNFDDCVEQMIQLHWDGDHIKNPAGVVRARPYEAIWDARLRFNNDIVTIYHPNGFLPQNPGERKSSSIVFAENSFADQLIDMMAGHYSAMQHYLLNKTCVIIGHSLNDSGLAHLLRQASHLNPGQVHYYVHFRKDSDGKEEGEELTDVLFENYNLRRLHLTGKEIAALLTLIRVDENDFRSLCKECKGTFPTSITVYVTGCIRVGKTTTISSLRSFDVFDEWPGPRHEFLLIQPASKLTDEQRIVVDDWVMKNIPDKNRLVREKGDAVSGIIVVDRCPVDAVTFQEPEGVKAKATRLRDAIPQVEQRCGLRNGHVIFLVGDPSELARRAYSKQGEVTPADMATYQEAFDAMWRRMDYKGITRIEIDGESIEVVIKRVLRRILFGDLEECRLDLLLDELCEKGY